MSRQNGDKQLHFLRNSASVNQPTDNGHGSSALGLCLPWWAHRLQRTSKSKQGMGAGAL